MYSHEPSSFLRKHVGEYCKVEFRRDALGAAASLPISPTTDEINGAQVVLWGKLLAVEGDGIVVGTSPTPLVEKSLTTYWIPNHAVLLVSFPRQ